MKRDGSIERELEEGDEGSFHFPTAQSNPKLSVSVTTLFFPRYHSFAPWLPQEARRCKEIAV